MATQTSWASEALAVNPKGSCEIEDATSANSNELCGNGLPRIVTDVYSREEVSFPSLVANQVALAVDDALNFDALQRAQEAPRASEQSFRMIVDSVPGLVVTTTPAGEIELLNRQVLEYFGKTPEELKSWTTSNAVHPDDLPGAIAAFKTSIETGNPYEVENRLRRADGVYRWFHSRGLPVRGTDGRIGRWYILFTDIDKRKQAEDRLQLLLNVTTQVVSNLQLSDLLRAISANIRRVMECDCASLALPDAENKELHLYMLDFPEGKGFLREEGDYSIEGSPYGTAFGTMKPLALDAPFSGWLNDRDIQSRIREGFKSLCFLPVIARSAR